MKINRENYNYQPPKIGMIFLQALIGVLFIILASRFWYLQILRGQEYTRLAEANRVRIEKILAPRGLIYDRFGEPLASNNLVFDLALVREDCPDVESALSNVANLLQVNKSKLRENFDNLAPYVTIFDPIPILEDITFEQVAHIENSLMFLPGVFIQTQSRRFYPDSEAFAHILGYVAKANREELEKNKDLNMGDSIGKQGLERIFEGTLRGIKGEYRNQRDALGKVLAKDLEKPSINGDNLTLSFDVDLQREIIELMGDYSGSVIVMDPESGHLHAMVTLPSYDANLFVRGLTVAEWQAISTSDDFPLHNRSIQGMYPPGSVWKLLMAGLFLENGISPREVVDCKGVHTNGKDTFRCWLKGGHGKVNMEKAIEESCDVYFYHYGEQMGIDKISDYAFRSGFGDLTGIDLPSEKSGLVPTREWKLKRHNEAWLGGETVNVSIGQGQTLVTPLQMAIYTSALVNGGKILKPLMNYHESTEVRGYLPISDENRQFIQNTMLTTARTGTANVLTRGNHGVTIGGKTGTAQVIKIQMSGTRRLRNEELMRKQRDHSWITSFAEYKGKQVVITTMVEHGGGGSSVAGPITRDVINYITRQEDRRNQIASSLY